MQLLLKILLNDHNDTLLQDELKSICADAEKVNHARRECSMHNSNVDQEHPLGCPSQDSLQ